MRRSSPSPFLFALLALAPLACATTDSSEDDPVARGDDALSVCPKGDTVKGLDVSHWQDSIDWKKVRGAGYRFAFAKATQGTDILDGYFDENWSHMKKEGLIRGAYHYIVPGSGAAQADYFLKHVSYAKGDLPPVVDVEAGGVKPDMVADWVTRVKEKTGRTPVVYTSNGAWNSKHHTDAFKAYPLWIAYWVDVECPELPHPWKAWSFFQYIGPTVPGIGNKPDHDVFNGSLAELEAFAGAGAPSSDEGVGASAHGAAVAINDHHLPELFAVANDGSLHHRGRSSSGWSAWHALGSAGGGFVAAPTAADDVDGRMEVAAVAHDGSLWLTWESAPADWASFYRFGAEGGGFVGQPVMTRDTEGRLHLFVRAKDDSLWHLAQKTAGGSWTSMQSLGSPGTGLATSPAVTVDGDGALHALTCSVDGALYEAHQAPGEAWTKFAKLGKPSGGCTSTPAASTGPGGRLDVFTDAADGALWHVRQQVGGGFAPIAKIGAPDGVEVWHPTVVANLEGEPEVFVRGEDGSAWHVWREVGGGFSNFHRFSGGAHLIGTPAALDRPDGAMEVFYRGSDDALWTFKEETDGSWKSEESLGVP